MYFNQKLNNYTLRKLKLKRIIIIFNVLYEIDIYKSTIDTINYFQIKYKVPITLLFKI